jgi:hypothetical protein
MKDRDLEATVALLQKQVADLLAKKPERRTKGRMTRGSVSPPEVDEPMTLDRFLQSQEPMSEQQLAKAFQAPEDEINQLARALETEDKIVNLGPEKEPRWAWKPGKGASPEDLTECVVKLITARPMTWRELMHATGASHGRLSGALTRAKEEFGAFNLRPDTPRRAVWFIPTK